MARDLANDPLAAGIKATVTLLEAGLLDGFRQGWRKSYVELLDAGAGGLLVAMAEAGGVVPVAEVDEGAWEQVAAAYGYEPDDATERSTWSPWSCAMMDQFSDCGVVVRNDDEVVLTGPWSLLGRVHHRQPSAEYNDAMDDQERLARVRALRTEVVHAQAGGDGPWVVPLGSSAVRRATSPVRTPPGLRRRRWSGAG